MQSGGGCRLQDSPKVKIACLVSLALCHARCHQNPLFLSPAIVWLKYFRSYYFYDFVWLMQIENCNLQKFSSKRCSSVGWNCIRLDGAQSAWLLIAIRADHGCGPGPKTWPRGAAARPSSRRLPAIVWQWQSAPPSRVTGRETSRRSSRRGRVNKP